MTNNKQVSFWVASLMVLLCFALANSALSEDTNPPTIYNLTPAPDSNISATTPTISADYAEFLSGWGYYKPITITNSGLVTLTYYQVLIDVPYNEHMQPDFDDLRFTNANLQLLSYWLEKKENGVSALVWVKVPSISAQSNTVIYMYYGNASAPNASNGANTFEFFEDFTATLNPAKWNKITYNGQELTYSIENGTIFHADGDFNASPGTGVFRGYQSTTTYGLGYAMRARVYIDHGQWDYNNDQIGFGIRTVTATNSYFVDIDNSGNPYDGYGFVAIANGAGVESAITWTQSTQYNVWDFIRQPNQQHRVIIGDLLDYTFTTYTPTASLPLTIGADNWSIYDVHYDYYVDYMLVRKYAQIQPTISIGAEQEFTVSGINPSTALMELDGNPVSFTANSQSISYTPASPLSYGTHNVYVYVEDNEGNPAEAEWAFNIDTTPPTGSIIINNNDWVTTSSAVTLTLIAIDNESGISQMNLKNEVGDWTGWIDYHLYYNWTLSPGLGNKTVSVQYKNGAGLTSGIYSANITLAQDHGGADWTLTDQSVISGIHYNITNFTVSGTVSTTPGYILEINAQNIYITGTLSADGMGYGPGQGQGHSEDVIDSGSGGASHFAKGGVGDNGGFGNPAGPVYGTVFDMQLGSGSGSASHTEEGIVYTAPGAKGGGVIILKAVTTVAISGLVSANGENGSSADEEFIGSGGGSGGSIWIFADSIECNGLVSCNGGDGGIAYYGGGGGGPGNILLQYNIKYSTNFTCNGGIHGSTGGGNGENASVGYNARLDYPIRDYTNINDPLYINTGEFYQEVTDLTIPGRGFPFRFTRNYRAQGWYNGTLGYGWDFNYNARIEKIASHCPSGMNDINYYDGTGRIDKYDCT